MRSMLFVPGDSLRKFQKARTGTADVLILDLEDSVAAAGKVAARDTVRQMLDDRGGKSAFVRVNAFDTGLTVADLAAVTAARPDGIVLPKSESVRDVERLSTLLDAFEAAHGIAPGTIGIVAIATETARSLFGLQSYTEAGPRLRGLMWGAEDLAASLGASSNKAAGRYHSPFIQARDLCLAAAAAANVAAIDTVYTEIAALDGLRLEAETACRDGFTAKAVIHPSHVDVVNAAFTPTEDQVEWARKVLALTTDPAVGVLVLDGKMIDRPHVRAAERILARAAPG